MHSHLSSSLGDFLLAVPLVFISYFMLSQNTNMSLHGIGLALLSGEVTSAGAYVLWYTLVQRIDHINARIVQLSVPCLVILGGALFIGESIGMQMILSVFTVLLGVFTVIYAGKRHVK